MAGADDDLWRALLEQSDVLMYAFDFEPLATPTVPAHVCVLGAQVHVCAQDATGGVYLDCFPTSETPRARESERVQTDVGSEDPMAVRGERYILHVDARGYAHGLADSLLGAVALVVELPYWREILTVTQGGEASAMRAVALRLEREVFDDIPTLGEAREYLRRELRLPPMIDPIAQLHRLAAYMPPEVTPIGADGTLLFPQWRTSTFRSAV